MRRIHLGLDWPSISARAPARHSVLLERKCVCWDFLLLLLLKLKELRVIPVRSAWACRPWSRRLMISTSFRHLASNCICCQPTSHAADQACIPALKPAQKVPSRDPCMCKWNTSSARAFRGSTHWHIAHAKVALLDNSMPVVLA